MGTKITPFNLHTSVDSHVKGLIDSDYVQARSGSGGTDSASTQAMIDSNFTNMDINVHMPDNQKITFGADSDLEIMHLGTYSRIRDKGTGNLVLAVDDLQVTNSAVTENILIAQEDGAVELYYDNTKKFETTDSGATVTGDLQVLSTDGGGGNGPVLDLWRNSPSPSNGDHIGTIQFNFENDADEKIQGARIYAEIDDDTNGTEDGAIFIDGLRNGSTYGYMEMAFGRVNILSDTLQLKNNASLSFEGSTTDDHETFVVATDPTADRTITIPDASGTVILNTGDQNITGDVTITSTDAGTSEDPNLNLHRNSSSPAANDLLGSISFKGQDAGDNTTTYAKIQSVITDTTDGSEDGILRLRAAINGSMTTYYDAGYGANFFYKNVALHTGVNLSFEGSTDDTNETTLTVTDPTADRTITLPDASGTVALTSDISVTPSSTTTLTNKTLTDPVIHTHLDIKDSANGISGGLRIGPDSSNPEAYEFSLDSASEAGFSSYRFKIGNRDVMQFNAQIGSNFPMRLYYDLDLHTDADITFQGSTSATHETILTVQDASDFNKTITLPNLHGRVNELLISYGSMNTTSLVFDNSSLGAGVGYGDYSELRLVLSNCKPSTQTGVYMRVGSSNSADGGTNYGQAYYVSGYYGSATAYSVSYVDHDATYFVLADNYAQLGTGTGQNGHFEITFLNPNTTSHYKFFKINSQIYSYYPMLLGRYIDAAVWKSTAAINYIRVYPSTGNLALEYKLYGVKS